MGGDCRRPKPCTHRCTFFCLDDTRRRRTSPPEGERGNPLRGLSNAFAQGYGMRTIGSVAAITATEGEVIIANTSIPAMNIPTASEVAQIVSSRDLRGQGHFLSNADSSIRISKAAHSQPWVTIVCTNSDIVAISFFKPLCLYDTTSWWLHMHFYSWRHPILYYEHIQVNISNSRVKKIY